MIRKRNGTTEVRVRLHGLNRSTTYPAHVHNLPCRLGGGGHYKFNESVSGAVESNEIWVPIQTQRRGAGRGFARVPHTARAEAASIVVHDPADGARLACIDLD
jgi:hypothetical protein